MPFQGSASPTMLPQAVTGAFEVGIAMFSPTWLLFPFEAISISALDRRCRSGRFGKATTFVER